MAPGAQTCQGSESGVRIASPAPMSSSKGENVNTTAEHNLVYELLRGHPVLVFVAVLVVIFIVGSAIYELRKKRLK
jgi:hypothetical protein